MTYVRRHAGEGARFDSEVYLGSRLRRSIDVSLAAALLILLAPAMLIIAASIRLTSPGPVLFRQKRNGRGLQPFELLKFRTMYWQPEGEATIKQAAPGDSRITGLGRVLRRTSLDELPQLINVLRGEMSLIGPRPHALEHDEYYLERIPTYARRFNVRPGLTGLAQVSGARGATPRLEDMERRVMFDLKYIETATPGLDARIFLRTVTEVFSSHSAY